MTTINGLSIGTDSVTIILDATPHTVPRTQELIEAILANDFDKVKELVNPAKNLEAKLARFGDVVITNGHVLYKDMEVQNGHVRRILELMELGLPVDSVALNLNSMLRNPSFRVRRDYSDFVDRFNLPFAPDGRSVFAKNVRSDFRAIHGGRVDWSIGQTVTMPREDVDDDPTRTCSSGLHVCAPEYLPHFAQSDGHTINVLVWPEHIVALPVDYNLSKLRVCEAYSHSVIPPGDVQKYYDAVGPLFTSGFDPFEDEAGEYDENADNENEDAYTTARGPFGFLNIFRL